MLLLKNLSLLLAVILAINLATSNKVAILADDVVFDDYTINLSSTNYQTTISYSRSSFIRSIYAA